MKKLVKLLKQLYGILGFLHFAPDNHVIPVLRFGLYHRAPGPGWIWTFPLLERALPPVKTSIYLGKFYFEEVMSRDNVPFAVQMTVLFRFDPDSAHQNAAAALVKTDEDVLQSIVKDYANQGLRRLSSRFRAEELSTESSRSDIEQNLTRFLTAELGVLGIAPLRPGGVLIKEIIAPEKFKRGILNATRVAAMLQTLMGYYSLDDLIHLAIQAGLVTGYEDMENANLAFLPELESLRSQRTQKAAFSVTAPKGLTGQNGHNGPNGH